MAKTYPELMAAAENAKSRKKAKKVLKKVGKLTNPQHLVDEIRLEVISSNSNIK